MNLIEPSNVLDQKLCEDLMSNVISSGNQESDLSDRVCGAYALLMASCNDESLSSLLSELTFRMPRILNGIPPDLSANEQYQHHPKQKKAVRFKEPVVISKSDAVLSQLQQKCIPAIVLSACLFLIITVEKMCLLRCLTKLAENSAKRVEWRWQRAMHAKLPSVAILLKHHAILTNPEEVARAKQRSDKESGLVVYQAK